MYSFISRSASSSACSALSAAARTSLQRRNMGVLDSIKETASKAGDQLKTSKETITQTKPEDYPDEAKGLNTTNLSSKRGTAWEETSREATGQSEKIEEQLKGTGGVKAEGAQEKH